MTTNQDDEIAGSLTDEQMAAVEEIYCRPHKWVYGPNEVVAQLNELRLYQKPEFLTRALTYRGSQVVRELCRRGNWPPSKHLDALDARIE